MPSSQRRRSKKETEKTSKTLLPSKDTKSEKLENATTVTTSAPPPTIDNATTGHKKGASKRRWVDTEDWVSRHADELASALGLESLGLTREELVNVLTRIVETLRGDSASLDLDTLVRRAKRHSENVYSIISSLILELRSSLTSELLEFTVQHIGEAVLAHAQRLYQELKRLGREDLIERVRLLWNKYWVMKRHPLLPVACPHCGFNALTPELYCMVCGATVAEKRLKESINFKELIEDFVKASSKDSILTALRYGYVLLNSLGVKAPNEPRDALDIEIVLSREEKEYMASLLEKKS